MAASVLAALALLSPWPFGGVLPSATLAIVLVSLLAALGVVLWGRGDPTRPAAVPSWPLAALLTLALVQLLPLPGVVLRALSPGSAAVWLPAEPAAASVLGSGPHPVSIHVASTVRWLLFALAIAGLTLGAARALRKRQNALRMTIALVAGGLAVGVYGLLARLVFGSKLYGVLAVPTVAPFGPFVSKNHFAGYLEGLALLAVGLAVGFADHARRETGALGWIDGARAPRVVWAAGAAGVLILAVGASLSRGGVFALAAGAVAFVVLRSAVRRRRRNSFRGLLLSGAALGVVAVLGFFLLPEAARARVRGLPSGSEELSGSYRLAIWRDTLRLAVTSPLMGYGFGTYEDALPRFKTDAGEIRVEHAENDWLELLAEGGLLALGLALTLVVATLRRVVLGLREQGDRILRGLGLGALAGALALVAHSFVDFNLRIPSNALVFAGLVALAAGASRPTSKEPEPPPRIGERSTRVAGTLVLSLALGVAVATPWAPEPAGGSAPLHLHAVRPGAPLRQAAAEAALTGYLRSRPADAAAWTTLTWVCAQRNRTEARELAAHALALDPLHPGVRKAAGEFAAATGGTLSRPSSPP